MVYPFLALVVASRVQGLARNSVRVLRCLFSSMFALLGTLLLLVGTSALGGAKVQTQIHLVRGPICLAGFLLAGGSLWVLFKRADEDAGNLVTRSALLLALCLALVLPWSFVRLDPLKDYQGWAHKTEPLLANHRVYFWGDLRSGAIIYSDRLTPVISDPVRLAALGPDDRLIVADRRWKPGIQGLDVATMNRFQSIYHHQQGGDGLQILAPLVDAQADPTPPRAAGAVTGRPKLFHAQEFQGPQAAPFLSRNLGGHAAFGPGSTGRSGFQGPPRRKDNQCT
jgi:hypothetical protein